MIAVAPAARASESAAQALAGSLGSCGIDTVYVGRLDSPRRVAAAAAEERATTVELCIGSTGGATWVRDLLRELRRAGRSDVSIVVHRTE
jgi:methylmalonyl-CoA mutase cobalamin-binding domain/chain